MTALPTTQQRAEQLGQTLQLATRIADEHCLTDIECECRAEVIHGIEWYDLRPLLDPEQWPAESIAATQECIDYALRRRLAARHPQQAHLLRILPPAARGESILIDTADVVHHVPTGEEWVVAYVQGDRLSWCGWPPGLAAVADCVVVKRATPEERLALLRSMAEMTALDTRATYARERLQREGAAG